MIDERIILFIDYLKVTREKNLSHYFKSGVPKLTDICNIFIN